MTTTISVQAKGQLALPREFCARKHLRAGTALRVTEVGEGLYLTPIPEPTEAELKQVLAAAGSLLTSQTAAEEALVAQEVAAYRSERRRQRPGTSCWTRTWWCRRFSGPASRAIAWWRGRGGVFTWR